MLGFFRGKRVLITGHTGFKGSWLCHILVKAGAKVTGYSLVPPTTPSLFEIDHIGRKVDSVIGDIRDLEKLKATFNDSRPEIVFHLAAQSLVRTSYKEPRYTYETNIMGTVNVLECVRQSNSVKSFVNVTTDKVYENDDLENHTFTEDAKLDGYDPYSNSKSCSELITHSYKKVFLNEVSVSTARAGNVIGGGDFALDRILPDCFRACSKGESVVVRNPLSTRPYQHVLEPLFVYLLIAKEQCENHSKQGWYNIGPDDCDCLRTGMLVDLFVRFWGDGAKWVSRFDNGPHEAAFLKLDCRKLKKTFGWKPKWNLATAVQKTVEWYRTYLVKGDIELCMDRQIEEFIENVE